MGPKYDVEIELCVDGGTIQTTQEFYIEESLEDITEYFIEYYVDLFTSSKNLVTAKEIIKTIEKDWYTNNIDTLALYTENYDFITWLKEKYKYEATEAFIKDSKQ